MVLKRIDAAFFKPLKCYKCGYEIPGGGLYYHPSSMGLYDGICSYELLQENLGSIERNDISKLTARLHILFGKVKIPNPPQNNNSQRRSYRNNNPTTIDDSFS